MRTKLSLRGRVLRPTRYNRQRRRYANRERPREKWTCWLTSAAVVTPNASMSLYTPTRGKGNAQAANSPSCRSDKQFLQDESKPQYGRTGSYHISLDKSYYAERLTRAFIKACGGVGPTIAIQPPARIGDVGGFCKAFGGVA